MMDASSFFLLIVFALIILAVWCDFFIESFCDLYADGGE